jgi:hypothetical protein
VTEDRIGYVDETISEINEIERILDRDRRTADPARGVICVLRCAERPCVHTAFLVESIIREEEDR